jgi:hypothetical protein
MWIGSFEEIKCEDYCEHHCENFIVFMSDPHKEETLGACDELFWDVVLHKDLILGVLVILSQKNVRSHVGNHMNDEYCKCCVQVYLIVYLCARRD